MTSYLSALYRRSGSWKHDNQQVLLARETPGVHYLELFLEHVVPFEDQDFKEIIVH